MKGRLTAAMVRATKEPGLYGDGGTLYLKVAPGGSKSWVQRITVNGKRRDIGLGLLVPHIVLLDLIHDVEVIRIGH